MPITINCIVEVLEKDEKGNIKIIRTKDFELSVCPFCGDDPVAYKEHVKTGIDKVRIFCRNCFQGQGNFIESEISVYIWNKRISND